MSILDRVRAFFQPRAQSLADRFRSWFEPTSIFTRLSSDTLANNETIFAAVSRLANAMASLPLRLYDAKFAPVSSHPAAMLLYNPNPNQTLFDFIRTMEAIRDTEGNSYALKEYDMRYQVKALWILDPGKVKEVVEKDTRELWYEIEGDKGRYYVHNMDVLHVKHIHGYGYRGISPLKVLTNTVEFDRKVKSFSLEQMDGAVKASFILQMNANLSEERKADVLNSFKRFYQENGGVLIQEQGMKIDPIERKFIDTKVFEAERITRTRVATVYNMPAHMLGEAEGVNYSSMEQMNLEFVQNTLVPIVTQYEKEFCRKLLTESDRKSGLYWKFNINALLRGDMQTRGEFYFKGVRSGLFKPNEIRAWEDLPPEPGGDKLLISGDLYPIDQPRERK